MFGGNMQQMMKQMGADVDQIDADKVEIHVGDKKMVFDGPSIQKMDLQGKQMFMMNGNYSTEKKETEPEEEDVELVMDKTGASREDAEEALKNADDVAEAVMELS